MTRVLVLEDDKDLRNLYTKALKFKGYDVKTAACAENALEMMADDHLQPDIAVLDMSMPGLPGSAVVEYIRAQVGWDDLPIIVISCDEDFRISLADYNIDFMPKPINISDLFNRMATKLA